VGLRDDIYAGLKNQLSPNANGAAWLNPHLKLRAAVSRAFRLPTYTDLFYSDPASLGNPNLKPETAWNYEGGLDWRMISATVFQRHDNNVVDYVQAAPGELYRATNFQNIVFTGAEVGARWHGFSLAYTYLHGNRSLQAGELSRYVFNYPVHNGVATWEGNLRWGLIARTRIGAQQRIGQGSYAVWDASIASTKGRVQPFLQLTNLTDTYYQQLPRVSQPSRGVIGGIKLTLVESRGAGCQAC
jgi:outer membrane receptor protein involved in Fe transport